MNLEKNEEIIGVIHALQTDVIANIFINKKDIFVKYTPHVPTKKSKNKLKEGMVLFIYESRNLKEIVGKAVIQKIEYLIQKDIIKKYYLRLMISPEKLQEYAGNRRKEKPALVLTLNNITKYKKPIKLDFPITMGGLYVTSNNRREILGDAQ